MNKIISFSLLFSGVVLLVYTWKPIFEWHFFIKPKITESSANFLSPLADLNQPVFDERLSQDASFASLPAIQSENTQTFYLTIAKFGIVRVKAVTGDDFVTTLAHLPNSSLPGAAGNIVISGHSTLPQFFSPGNYISIFSKLYLLESGDKIILEDNNQTYTYTVTEMLVVGPKDTWVLRPPDPYNSYLTLLTCRVGGFSAERIIVRGTLSNSQNLI